MRQLSRKQLQKESRKYQSRYPYLRIHLNESTISLKVKYDYAARFEGRVPPKMHERQNDQFAFFRTIFYSGQLDFS